MNRKPLHPMSDNVHIWRLGEAAREAMEGRVGDPIDRGLILLRLLNERGYQVVPRSGVLPLSMGELLPADVELGCGVGEDGDG